MRSSMVILLVLVAGCHRLPSDPEGFALRLVDEARRGTLPAAAVDDAVAERVRRVQLWKRVPGEAMSAAALAELWRASAVAPEDPATRRRHAAHALTQALGGHCEAAVDRDERDRRLAALGGSVARAPAEAQVALAQLRAALADSELVRVMCERGQAAMLLRRADPWRVVDLYPLGSTELTLTTAPR